MWCDQTSDHGGRIDVWLQCLGRTALQDGRQRNRKHLPTPHLLVYRQQWCRSHQECLDQSMAQEFCRLTAMQLPSRRLPLIQVCSQLQLLLHAIPAGTGRHRR